MSEKVGRGFICSDEKPQQCDLCGKIAELRPYGPKKECICFECMKLDEEAAREQFGRRLKGGKP